MTNGLVAHGWLWDGLSYSNAPDSGRIGGRVWVAGETLSRDQWTSTFPCGGPDPLVLNSGFRVSQVWPWTSSVLLFLPLSCLPLSLLLALAVNSNIEYHF